MRLLWNPWRGIPQAYRICVAMPPLPQLKAAPSRAWLGLCHAERGAFTEGLAMAEDGLQIAETGSHPFSLIEACDGVSAVYWRQGDVHRAIPVLERAMGLCEDWHILNLLPRQTAALGLAYAKDG